MTAEDLEQAAQQLLPGPAARPWPLQQGQARVRSGVRASPARTAEGNMPIAGRLAGESARGRYAQSVRSGLSLLLIFGMAHACLPASEALLHMV